MNCTSLKLPFVGSMLLAIVAGLSPFTAVAQARPQITQQLSESQLTTLSGNVQPNARAEYDQGAMADSAPTGRLMLVLKRSATQESALQQFLQDAHSKGSASYHQWLTPVQFGQQYGPADSDVATVTSWLQSHGFTVTQVSPGKSTIEFSGTAGQVKSAFHTELHSYNVNGTVHHANSTDPQIPAALTPVVAGVSRLNDFLPKSQLHSLGKATYNLASHQVKPNWTTPAPDGSGGTYFAVGPKDFATQYNVTPVYSAGTQGSGQIIGIINDSNIDLGLVSAYRKIYGLDADATHPNLPHVIIDGNDPGIFTDAEEAYLDVETAGAVAPLATVNLYIATNTDLSSGLDLAVQRAVTDDTANVLSLSFGGCEASIGAAGNQFYSTLWEQAAAQGQTVVVSTGDAGATGCDAAGNPTAFDGLQVNGLASTPWNVAVGGTDFYYSDYATGGASASKYWSATNDVNLGSLKSPVPEQPWNDSQYGLDSVIVSPEYIAGGGGGQSTCSIVGGPLQGQNAAKAYGYCKGLGGYAKPAWQAGTGVPSDLVRDLPDLSLFAADGVNFSFYAICAGAGDCVNDIPGGTTVTYTGVGGTSASAPAFAGIMALVDQQYGSQGQADYVLYPLAKQFPAVFHDITVGSTNEPCSLKYAAWNCTADATGGGASEQEWPATKGYDLATGLGSLDVNALITNWNSISTGNGTTTTFTVNPATITHGQKAELTASVAAISLAAGTPSGAVAIIANTTLPASKAQTMIQLGTTGIGITSANYLPGGSYTIYGSYGGDGVFTKSASTPVSVTVNAENSIINVKSVNRKTFAPIVNGASIPYGAGINLDMQPIGVNAPVGGTDGNATGTTTVYDNGVALYSSALDSNGQSFYNDTGFLTIGSHSLTFSYSGDPSYNPSTTTNLSGPITFTVAQAKPFLFVSWYGHPIGGTAVKGTLPPGSDFVVQVNLAGSGGTSESGNLTITLGNLPPQTVPLYTTTPGSATATAIFKNLAAGSYQLAASYAGDANWTASTSTPQTIVVAASSLLPTTTSIAITSPTNLSTIQPGTLITVSATVTGPAGSKTAPSGMVQFFSSSDTQGPNAGSPVALVPGPGTTATATFTAPDYYGWPGVDIMYAVYMGDTSYNISTSDTIQYPRNFGDFTLTTTTPNVTIASGASASATVLMESIKQFSGNITLSCAITGGSGLVPLCSIPSTTTLTSTGQQASVAMQIMTSIPATVAQMPARSAHGLLAAESCVAFSFIFLLATPSRRKNWKSLLVLLFLVTLGSEAMVGCSGSGKVFIMSPGPGLVLGGTYTAVVTATNGTTTHNTNISIVVH